MRKRLAIISTHPIQYHAPVFQLLAKELTLNVFYTGGELLNKYDSGFRQHIEWDIPLLSGYGYTFLENTAKDKGSHHFNGIVNPDGIQRIRAFQPDAILIYGWAYQSHLNIMRYFKGKIPVCFRGDSNLLDQQQGLKNIIKRIALKWVFSHIDMAFYVGSANKAYFKRYGLKENQLVFAPHAIDNNRFGENRTAEVDQLKKTLKIKPSDLVLLFAGKLEPKKDPELLLDAFLSLGKENIHLLMVGNGVLEERLKTRGQGKRNIHFLPFQNQTQMPPVYQACDLFCLPSKGPGETWGLAVNEAMAAGKAVLVSDKVGCAEDLAQKPYGTIFKSGNLEDLIQKLIALTDNKDTLKKMGEHAHEYIQKWSFEEQVNRISIYVNR